MQDGGQGHDLFLSSPGIIQIKWPLQQQLLLLLLLAQASVTTCQEDGLHEREEFEFEFEFSPSPFIVP